MRRFLVISALCATAPALAADEHLEALVRHALEARPEIQQALAETRAAKERIPQAEGWADPMLEVGVQNDGFKHWGVGTMELSWISFMATQTFPFPGKTGLRGDVVRADVKLSELNAERVRLSTIAEVRRAYLSLQLARERLVLLDKLVKLNRRLVEAAKVRAETSVGTQAELLRAQVEFSRVTQRRFQLDADAHLQEELLNQLRQAELHEVVKTAPLVKELPTLMTEKDFLDVARQRSPELLAAHAGYSKAEAVAALARRTQFPDFSVSAGLMVRGPLEPMWSLTVGVPLPVFTIAREVRRGAEATALKHASERAAHTTEELLALRARHRAESLNAYTATWHTYQQGLLAQLDLAADSMLGSYSTGRATLGEVLEVNALNVAETEAALQVLVDAQRLLIEQDELSPAEPPGAPRMSRASPSSAAPASSSGM